jgi:hypothetical protein
MSTRNDPENKSKKPSQKWGLDLLTFPPPASLNPFELTEEPPPPKRAGLFEQLLYKDVHHLIRLLASTGGTDAETTELLNELAAGTRRYESLHPEEQLLLDEATARAVSEPEIKRKINKPFQKVMEKRAEADIGEAPPVGADALPAFWWV